MGNTVPSCCNQGYESHVNDLISLTQRSYQCSNHLFFDPFAQKCCLQNAGSSSMSQNWADLENPEISEESSQRGNAMPIKASEEPIFLGESVEVGQMGLQKNQRNSQKNSKSKKIRKTGKSKKGRDIQSLDSDEAGIIPEEMSVYENSTNVMENTGIRDQNNCKSYHKLVKNYLLSKGLGGLFDDVGVEYHTRYYFIVALIFIKYYLKDNFNTIYQEIVRKELEAQRKKISKKQAQKEKVEKDIRQTRENARNYQQLLEKKKDLEKKISHISVVIHEIEDFSVRSCRAFFSGNTEESLRILYLKDDAVMRKKYYFDSALDFVNQLQIKVRQAASLKS